MRLDTWIRLDIWTSHVQRARHRRYLGAQAPHKKRARVAVGKFADRGRAGSRAVIMRAPLETVEHQVPWAGDDACRGQGSSLRRSSGGGTGRSPCGLGNRSGRATPAADRRVRIVRGHPEAVAVRAGGPGLALLAPGAGIPLRSLTALRTVGTGRPGGATDRRPRPGRPPRRVVRAPRRARALRPRLPRPGRRRRPRLGAQIAYVLVLRRGMRPPWRYLRTGADGASRQVVPPLDGSLAQPERFMNPLIRISGTDG